MGVLNSPVKSPTVSSSSNSHSLPSSPIKSFQFDSTAVPSFVDEKQEDCPEGFIRPGIVKKSKLLGVGKGIGFRSIPPFRKRVVSLPPVPIVTQQGLLEQSGTEKQVRFFTNVICHEYQSY